MPAKAPSVVVALDSTVMSPTFAKGSVLVGRFGSECARWDVVGFRYYLTEDEYHLMAGWNGVAPDETPPYQQVQKIIGPPQIHLIGRVIALGGETLELKADGVYIDGQKIKPPRTLSGLFTGFGRAKEYAFGSGALIVPDGTIFVVKDNLEAVMDSRRFGPIQVGQIMGKVITTTTLPQLGSAVRADIHEFHPSLAN